MQRKTNSKKNYNNNNNNKSLILLFAGLTVGIILTWNLLLHDTLGKYFYVLHGTSMLPNYKVGDLIIMDGGGRESFDSIKIGDDVIVFHTHDPEFVEEGSTVMHRVNATGLGGDMIITKGDANAMPEPLLDYPIYYQDYKGKVIASIPGVGLPDVWIHNYNTTDTLPTGGGGGGASPQT